MRRALALIAALSAVAACGGDGGSETIGRDGSVVVDDADPVVVGEPLGAWSVTYRVDERDGDDVLSRDATFTIERPFRSRFVAASTTRVADFGYFGEREAGDETEVLTAGPAPAPGDVRADLLDLDDGREVRRVAGRTCQVHVFGASLLAGQVVDGEGIETCIDGDGLVLEEIVTDGDRIVSRWLATEVDTSPATDEDDFRFAGVVARPADDGGGSVQEVEPTSRSLGTFFELETPPEGFRHRGRYAIVPPQNARVDDELTRARFVAGVVDVWVRGIDVLVVEQGGTLGSVPALGAHPNGELVDELGAVGATAVVRESIRTANGSEVRVILPEGKYVKVVGTIRVDELVTVARALTPVEGAGLVYR